jgi:hypothetical protein
VTKFLVHEIRAATDHKLLRVDYVHTDVMYVFDLNPPPWWRDGSWYEVWYQHMPPRKRRRGLMRFWRGA